MAGDWLASSRSYTGYYVSPEVNNWLGRRDLQLVLRDIKDLSMEEAFLRGWFESLVGLYYHGMVLSEAGLDLAGVKIQRTDSGLSLVRELFLKSTGNLLMLNGYLEVLDAVSMLSLHPNTETVFGRLEGYSAEKTLW